MATVTVKTLFTLAHVLGDQRELTISLSEKTRVKDALAILLERFGKPFEEELLDGDSLKNGITIFVNGVTAEALDGLDTLLKDQDTLLIMPPVGGG
ncbi:MAG TPA: molybdopterin synthase sulfur carrier subunit [Eubacteriaceae bacterium]|nr:molybdopterin synthase sulfur carrier subunit [Eubacteriaceae bacterium]